AHRDDDREGPLDDLEQRHHGDADVPGDMHGTTRVTNGYTGALPGAPTFHAPAHPDTPIHARCLPGRLGRRLPAPRVGHGAPGARFEIGSNYPPHALPVCAEGTALIHALSSGVTEVKRTRASPGQPCIETPYILIASRISAPPAGGGRGRSQLGGPLPAP